MVLDAIERGGPDRAAVARAALEPRERESPLGRFRVRSTGDVEGLAVPVTDLSGARTAEVPALP
jgi:hypothetical protein